MFYPHLALTSLFLLATLTASEIRSIEMGTVTIEDKFLRLNTCIRKQYQLQMRKEYYDQHADISALASIASMKMDDNLAFQFLYSINCLSAQCFLEVNLERFTTKVNEFFDY